ncbi:MAG: hypothetical protein A2665_01300 [Candidatus Zambryskibacteria bacterium RIFCSPHIGHO2_01_FULL_46_30]|uniref:Uncharacterized protein n=1 Tax=Candidatus Zambryskibacteria bacterium RIFCSPHIGHO2_01_FULL_46_30 TaxID=1802739 RepID=A0A1G2T1A0_9BACT|nr:MAG: hypothetical protein A2665_01300 [Candidatus Zambryskibacteria bacterium RIFCSPHIGHO2_01_FULL_46_30]OHB05790.1 MAG: hypothetical protein A3B22_01990 [Candidatus Zambryskibacteria bacterium RIFCSPLOWO2_01_FULL_47_33]
MKSSKMYGYINGKIATSDKLRFMPEAKTTHYITTVKLQPKRKKAKAVEILFVSNGKVLECATSNIFMFLDNTLITPKDSGRWSGGEKHAETDEIIF